MDNNQLLTFEEVKNYLKIGKSNCYALFNLPEFPTIRIGRKLFVMENDLIDWLKARRGATVIL